MGDDEVQERLRSYVATLEGSQRPVSLDEVVRRRRAPLERRRFVLAGVVALVALAVGSVAVVRMGDESDPLVAAGPRPTFEETSGAIAVDADEDRVVVLLKSNLVVLDAASGEVTVAIELSGAPADVSLSGDTAWVSLFESSRVARVDLAAGLVTATYRLVLPEPVCDRCPDEDPTAFLPVNIDAAPNAAWVSTARGYVARIDASSGEVTMHGPLEFDQTGPLAVYGEGVLVGQGNKPLVWVTQEETTPLPEALNPEGFPVGGVVTDLHSSLEHPELGVWGTVAVDSQPVGGFALQPPACCLTGDFEQGARVVGVSDRVWLQHDGGLRPTSAFDDPSRRCRSIRRWQCPPGRSSP